MARQNRNGRRAALEQKPRGKGGGLFMGLVIGLVIGLGIAAAMAWYFYAKPSEFKRAEQAPEPPQARPASKAAPAVTQESPPAIAATSEPAGTHEAPTQKRSDKPTAVQTPAPTGYTFFDILPGDRPSKPAGARLPREVWWLQVAALREEKDADRLKARLALLGLDVQVQQVSSGETTLHRVRVGPFKTEDEALGALDTLAVNNYEPRLFKEKLDQP